MAACGLRVGKTRRSLGAFAEARFDLRIKKDPTNSGPSNTALGQHNTSPLTRSERQLWKGWKGVLLLPQPIRGPGLPLQCCFPPPQQETLPGPLWETGRPGGPTQCVSCHGCFSRTAIHRHFLVPVETPSKLSQRSPSLWGTQWVSQKMERCGESTEGWNIHPHGVKQSPGLRVGRSEFLLLALLLCDQ